MLSLGIETTSRFQPHWYRFQELENHSVSNLVENLQSVKEREGYVKRNVKAIISATAG